MDLRRYQVAAGDVILCSSGALHDEFPRAGEPYRTLCIGIGALALPGLPAGCLIESRFSPVFRRPEQFDDLRQMFCQIDRYAAEREDGYQRLCQYLMLASPGADPADGPRAGGRARGPGGGHLPAGGPGTSTAITRRTSPSSGWCGRSISAPYHLSHMFKQKTGYTVKQYLLRRRLGEAQIRLASTQDSVQTIAEELGFEECQLLLPHLLQIHRPHPHGVPEIPDAGLRTAKKSWENDICAGAVRPPAQICPFQNGRGRGYDRVSKQRTDRRCAMERNKGKAIGAPVGGIPLLRHQLLAVRLLRPGV